MNRGGVKFQPEDVEDILLKHSAVCRAVMVGMPDERLGERNVCFIVPNQKLSPPSLSDITSLLESNKVAKFKWPERLEIVESLPLTPTGKVQRNVLRERLQCNDPWLTCIFHHSQKMISRCWMGIRSRGAIYCAPTRKFVKCAG